MGTALIYPSRPKVFALKFIRLMTKRCVATELGPQVFTLLCVIVTTEDARGYTDPVCYFNHQLMPLVGAGSEETLDRIRRKAVEAGWLNYVPGRKGVPGRYFVVAPEHFQGTDDAPTDEGLEGTFPRIAAGTTAGESTGGSAGEQVDYVTFPRTGAGTSQGEAKDNSGTLFPGPCPDPIAAVAAPGPKKKKKKPAKGTKPRPRNPLFDALVEVTGSDPVVNGKYVGKIVSLFASASPPYTPDEVHDFARDWRHLLPWAKPSEHPRLTLGIIEKYLPQLRAASRPHAPSGSDADAREEMRQELLSLVRNESITREEAEHRFGGSINDAA